MQRYLNFILKLLINFSFGIEAIFVNYNLQTVASSNYYRKSGLVDHLKKPDGDANDFFTFSLPSKLQTFPYKKTFPKPFSLYFPYFFPVMCKVGHFLNVRVIVDSRQSVEFFEVRVGGRWPSRLRFRESVTFDSRFESRSKSRWKVGKESVIFIGIEGKTIAPFLHHNLLQGA